MTTATPIAEIERIAAPSREVFERDYVAHNKPVIITGIVDKWPASAKWTPDYLESLAGDATVLTHYDEGGDHFNYYTPGGGDDRRLTFREYLRGITADPPERRYYLTQFSVADVSPELLGDIDPRCYMDGSLAVFFIGNSSYSPTHFHSNHEAFLCQISGKKTVRMYPPALSSAFYAYPWYTDLLNFARVDDRAPDLRRFPRFAKVEPITVELEEGEMLFIPVHWWHSVTAHDLVLSVTFFWPAAKSNYTFPNPGLRVLANRWLAPASIALMTKRALRKLKPGR